ncbi:MAG: Gfo/Idh/MocA family oxidoreductase [Armatimonadetes bacterium]|nr:Gfo/Idh/MocA family oxidoreductase [Armatimonadota bacterium]
MKQLRIAMVGAGAGRGQSWMGTLTKLTEAGYYDFCALCEAVPEKREASAERWGVKPYATLVELLDQHGVDVILNGTPPDCNMMSVPTAAKRGVHALTEIPIAPTLSMARYLMEVTEANNVKFEVSEQVYLWAKEQLKHRIIDSGLLGEIAHARCYYTNKADYHGINGVRQLIGSAPKRVLGYTQPVKVPTFDHWSGKRMSDDRWDLAVVEFEKGVTCVFQSPPRARTAARWDIEGTEGQLVGDNLHLGSHSSATHYPFVEEYRTVNGEKVLDHLRVDTDPPVVFDNPFMEYRAADGDEVARMQILLGMHRAITEDGKPEYGPENACTDIEVLFALRESHRRGNTWVDLPMTEPTELEKEMEAEFRRAYGHDYRAGEALTGVRFPLGGVRHTVGNWD